MSAEARSGSFASEPTEEPYPGIRRQTLTTAMLTLNRYAFEPGAQFPLHSHPQEQVTVVEEGAIELTVDGRRERLVAGQWSVVPGGIEHGIRAESEARITAIVAPSRASNDEIELASPEAGR